MFNRREITQLLGGVSASLALPRTGAAQTASTSNAVGLLNHMVGVDHSGQMVRMRLTRHDNPHSWQTSGGALLGAADLPVHFLGAGWESFAYARRTDGVNQLLLVDTKLWARQARNLSQLPVSVLNNVSNVDIGSITSFLYTGYSGYSDQRYIYFITQNGDLYWAVHQENATTQPVGQINHTFTAVKIGVNFNNVVGLVSRTLGEVFIVTTAGQVFYINDAGVMQRVNNRDVSAGSLFNMASMQPVAQGWLTPSGLAYDYVVGGGNGKIYCQKGGNLFLRNVPLSSNSIPANNFQILAHTSWPYRNRQWFSYQVEKTFYHPVRAYLNEISVTQGGDIQLCVSSCLPRVSVSICEVTFNTGFDPLIDADPKAVNAWNLREVYQTVLHNAGVQDIPFESYANGFNWRVDLRYRIPVSWRPGQYVMRVMDDRGGYCWAPLVIRPAAVNTGQKIAVLANLFTWRAYSREASGLSYYNPPYSQGLLSFRSPLSDASVSPHIYSNSSHLLGIESIFLAWLRREGYDFDVYTDEDIHLGRVDLSRYKAFVITGHPEFWTQNQFNRVSSYVDGGGKFINLGGNSVFYVNQYVSTSTGAQFRSPNWPQAGNLRTRYDSLNATTPNVNLIGTIYDEFGYGTYSSYKVLNSSHWLFSNTGLVVNSNFGFYKGIGLGSGHETDKVTPYLSRVNPGLVTNLQILARGNNPDSIQPGAPVSGRGGAEVVFFNRGNRGGWCLSTGSVPFVIPLRGNSDPAVVQMMKNIMNRL